MRDKVKKLWRKASWKRGDNRPLRNKSKRDRHTKKGMRSSMSKVNKRIGDIDFSPLYSYIISKVGTDYDVMHSYACKRIPPQHKDVINYLFVDHKDKLRGESSSYINLGESSYWSKLYIDKDNKIQLVNPNLSIEDLYPSCSCCTYTFNSKEIVNEWDYERAYFNPTVKLN